MAVTWGNVVGASSGGQMRLGYEFRQSPAAVVAGTSSVTLYLDIWVWTKWSVSDTSNTFACAGTDTLDSTADVTIDTDSNTSWASANQQLIRTVSRTFAPSYTATTPSSFSASLSGVEAVGTGYQAVVSGSWSTGQRPYTAPTAPSGVAGTRISDGQVNVSWTSNATSGAPYTTYNLQRWDNVTGAWATIKTGLTSASYSDTTVQADREYQYRVYVANTGGSATSTASASVYTTPAAPSDLVAAKAVSDIVLSWTDNSTAEEGFKVYESQDGGAYSLLATLGAGVTGHTHVAPSSSVTHTYQVKAYRGALASAQATSNTVVLLTNPAAPTALAIKAAADATEGIALAWQHNPVDGTAQTAYEVQYRVVGAGSWSTTGKITSTTQGRTFAAGTFANGNTYELQVRTWGQYATAPAYSPWSATKTFLASARPTATISSPADLDTLTGPSATVGWAYYDAESTAQSARKVTLYAADGTTVLWTQTVSDDAGSATIGYVLSDGATYVIGVMVRDADGLWSAEDAVTVDVDYTAPMQPALSAVFDPETGSVAITIDNPAPSGGEPAVVSNTVHRITGGLAEVVSDGVGPNGTVTDYMPALGVVNTYRVVAWSALPSAATSADVDLTVPGGPYCFFNWGPGYGTLARLAANVGFGGGVTPEQRYYQTAGRAFPLLVTGEALDETVSVSGDVWEDSAEEAAFDALARYGGEVMYRDMRGRRFVGGALVGLSEGSGPRIVKVTVEMRRTG
jgi:hypothetical protein